MYVCAHIYVYVYIYIYTSNVTYIHYNVCTCIHTSLCVYTYMCIYIYIYISWASRRRWKTRELAKYCGCLFQRCLLKQNRELATYCGMLFQRRSEHPRELAKYTTSPEAHSLQALLGACFDVEITIRNMLQALLFIRFQR